MVSCNDQQKRRLAGAIVFLGAWWAVASVILSAWELPNESEKSPKFFKDYEVLEEMILMSSGNETMSTGGCGGETYQEKLNTYIEYVAQGSKCEVPAGLRGGDEDRCTAKHTSACQWSTKGSAFYLFQMFTTIGESSFHLPIRNAERAASGRLRCLRPLLRKEQMVLHFLCVHNDTSLRIHYGRCRQPC
jgi:hypothetical protein